MARRLAVFLVLAMAISGFASGQQSGRKPVVPVKNSDVIDMTKAGIKTHTILLRIRQGPDSFDTSPQALIQLQKAGVNPEVMDTILLLARRSAPKVHAKPFVVLPAKPPAAEAPTGEALLEKALDAFGPREELEKVNAIRWVGTAVETTADGHTTSFAEQREEWYPGRLYMTVLGPAGALDKLVITPDFSYETSDGLTRAVGGESAAPYRQQIRFDPAYIAQHTQDYSIAVLGVEKKDDASTAVLDISRGDADYLWKIDADTGRLLSIQYRMSSGEMVTREYSDYQPVGDLSFAFEWRTTVRGHTFETTVHEYDVNPEDDKALFVRPGNLSGTTLSFRVLDSQSIAHGQEMDGNSATSCQLSQAANTSAVNPLDDVSFAEGTTPSNLQMTCNSWDTTKFWPRKLNAMLVMGSDGSAYILTCDQGPRSKCAPLHAGEVFQAMRTETGIAVAGVDVKGKEQDVTYSIAQAEKLP